MSAGRLAAALLALVAVAVGAVVLLGGDDDRYVVRVPLTNAGGLQDGSAVRIAGIDRGRVDLRLEPGDRVVAELELEDGAGPVGRDASVAVVSANFLGLKRVELDPGDARRAPVPSGTTVPADRVTTPTDLDQVLGVFDADTRTRAQVLLTEAGEAVVGRRVDIRKLLEQFPVGLEDASAVLAQLRADDRTMDDLLARSGRFVREVTRERRALTRMVDTVGDTAQTVAARRAQLRTTLARAPQTLRTLRGFLGDLETTTKDLGPAAREIAAAAPPLAATLREVDGFREAAAPTLDVATDAGPDLSRLATKATPVLRRARPTAQAVAGMAQSLKPVSDTLDGSADNIIAILENWSRAIQFRDGLGHVFRGEASVSPDLVLTMVDRLTKGQEKRREQAKAPAAPDRRAPARPDARRPDVVKDLVERLPSVKQPLLPKVGETVQRLPGGEVLKGVTDAVDGVLKDLTGRGHDDGRTLDGGLLDLLLGP
ncbi:MlaD family protein [Conexibacter sp. SYSU D00693]|uniref:MlaD family protein n=1 Tax=Conexibacter sp. SYSU D00693 TaxID=2812560 RepID=UPI00196B8403|nr:MlaD family protein [Conexibacter sp. SYSU D00693]